MSLNKEDYARLLEMNKDELYTELGKHLEGEPGFYGIEDPALRGRRWLQEHLGTIRELVCGPDGWPKYRKLPESKVTHATLAFLDAALAAKFKQYPVVTISVLLLAEGLDRVCGIIDDE